MATASVATSCIVAMQDGMDQGKFRCPRLRGDQSKLLSGLFRPKLHVAGTWIHGKCLYISVSDEDSRKDAAAQIQQLMIALDEIYSEHHRQLPCGLNVQCDNTYREGKNRHIVNLHILLVSLGVFRWTSASYLRVGHSGLLT